MQKKRLSTLITASLCLLFSIACKKDKEQTKTDMLVGGQWRVTAFTISPAFDVDADGDLDTDLYVLMDACEKDDYIIFKDNGKYEVNEGATKCDPLDPQVEELNWSFANNETELVMDGDAAAIKELTNSRLKVEGTVFGRAVEVTFTK